MSIINEMIKSSKINPNEKRRWEKRRTIPREVLNSLRELGIVLESGPPRIGMGLMRFLELLWDFILSCPDQQTSAQALNLYQDTVEFELMPNWRHKIKQKKPRTVWSEKTEKPITINRDYD